MGQLKYADVLRRHRCMFYELFEFMYPRRGELAENDEQGRRAILQDFIKTHDVPKNNKAADYYSDGGQHTVSSLLDTIRNTVSRRASQNYSKTTPLQTFFDIGHESVKRPYYEELRKTYQEQYPRRRVPNRWALSRAEERAESGNEDAKDAVVTKRKAAMTEISGPRSEKTLEQRLPQTNLSHNDQLAVGTVPKRRAIEREIVELERASLDYDPPKDKGRVSLKLRPIVSCTKGSYPRSSVSVPRQKSKRSHDEIQVSKPLEVTTLSLGLDAADTPAPRQSFRRLEPDQAARVVNEQTQSSQSGAAQTGSSTHTIISRPTPYSRDYVSWSKIKRRMDSIHSSLWGSLRYAFVMLHYQWHEPGQVLMEPGEELERLYNICLGKRWRSTAFDFMTENGIASLDLFAAIVGAAIYADVFQATPPTEARITLSIPDMEQKQYLSDFYMNQGLNFQNLNHNASVAWAQSDVFTARNIRPAAARLTESNVKALLEHLSTQPTTHTRADYSKMPDMISEAVQQAFEGALSLTAELYAAGESIVYNWYSPGCEYDSKLMGPGTLSRPVDMSDGQKVAVTFLPGVGIRESSGEMVAASRAIVTVAP